MDNKNRAVCTQGFQYSPNHSPSSKGDQQEMDYHAFQFFPFFWNELCTAVQISAVTYRDLGKDTLLTPLTDARILLAYGVVNVPMLQTSSKQPRLYTLGYEKNVLSTNGLVLLCGHNQKL